MAHGTGILGLKRITAITSLQNLASIKALRKLRLRFERMVRLKEDEPELEFLVSNRSATDTDPG